MKTTAETKALIEAAKPLWGKMPDKAIAEALRVDTKKIQYIRKKLKVAVFNPSRSTRVNWTPENIALLGTKPDTVIASELGIHPAAVGEARKRRGIPAFSGPGTGVGRKPTPGVEALGKDALPFLGQMPDSEVAKKFRVKKAAIVYLRKKHGVEAFDKARSVQGHLTPEVVDLLGSKPDNVLAAEVGVHPRSVFMARKRRGIEAFRPKPISWEEVKSIDQSEFFRVVLHNSGLTRKALASAACVSFSRVEKWAAPGTGREPMALYIRRLIYLTATYTPGFKLDAE